MMKIEKMLNLDEYEIADEITNVEMINILNGFESSLATIASDFMGRLFKSKISSLKQMQIVVETHTERCDKLVEQLKYKFPAEVNRFMIKLVDIQFTYTGYIVGESMVKSALKEASKELYGRLIKKSEYENIEEIKIKKNNIHEKADKTTEVTININEPQIDKKSKTEMELVLEELKALREEVQELKNQINS